MDKTEQKIKHLELIQGIINRMTLNSFMIKGWCITLVSAIFVLADKSANIKIIIIAYISTIVFWILDSYFLYQERLFRSLYDDIRQKDETDFSMDVKKYIGEGDGWEESFYSPTLKFFYGSLIIISFIIASITYLIQ